MQGLRLTRNAAKLFGACIIASFAAIDVAKADEGGVSFWVPGFFGSLAATPLQPGWSLTNIYYHTSVSADADVARAREFTLRRVPVNLQLSANLTANLSATGDLGIVLPMYTFTPPVLGGQLSVGVLGSYGRVSTSLAAQLTGNLTIPGLVSVPFSRFDSISDSVSGFGDVLPIATLRWNNGVHNYMTYITGDVPIGAYDSTRLSNIGIAESARTGLMKCSKRLTGLVVHSITSSARRSSVERISMPSFGVLQTNERAGPLFDLDQG